MSSSVLKNVIQPKAQTSRLIQPQEESQPVTRPLNAAAQPEASPSDDMNTVLGALVENAPVAMAIFDRSMRYMLANRQWLREFGLQHVQPIAGRSQYEIFPNLHPGWRQVYERALQGHIVRSEHDADGRNMVYRWEVRPWRRQGDASVGGLMLTCEKFLTGAAKPEDFQAEEEAEKTAKAPLEAAEPLDCGLPLLVLDRNGVIQRANATAMHQALDKGIAEGKSAFWEAFTSAADAPRLRQQFAEACSAFDQDPEAAPQALQARSSGETAPGTWMLSNIRQPSGAGLFSLIRLPVAPQPAQPLKAAAPYPPAPEVKPAAPPPPATVVDTQAISKLESELSRAKQELRTMLEAERAFVKRETRLRSFLEAVPCGLFVLDERGGLLYQNERLTRMLGRAIDKDAGIEDWLTHACPTPEHREQVALVWRESVWRRQLTRTVSLATADGLLKEIEFQPVSLAGGAMLVSIQDVTENCRHEEQLRSMEAKLRAILQADPCAIVLTDRAGVIFEVNQHAEQLLGQPKSELRRYPLDAWLEPESAAARRDALRVLRAQGQLPEALGVRVKRADGSTTESVLHLALVPDAQGEPHCTLHYFHAPQSLGQPIEAPQASEAVLEENPPELDQEPEIVQTLEFSPPVVETILADLLACDSNGRIVSWSAPAREIFDFDEVMAVGRPLHLLFRPSDATGFFFALAGQAATPESVVEHSYFGALGRGSLPLCVRAREEGGYQLLTPRTIVREAVPVARAAVESTAPARSPRPRAASGAMAFQVVSPGSQRWPVADLERERLMLSETHHRIKNHLQIISSLLNMQINGVSDQDARDALRASQNRVRAIAALHQHLHQMAVGGAASFHQFVGELVEHLRQCYEAQPERVRVNLDIQEGFLQPEWHMPLALTLNEALSNSFEHAFPHGREGGIHASLRYSGGMGELVIRDDGVGFAPEFHPGEAPGLGLKILAVFAEQMRGQLFIQGTPDGGSEIKLRFPLAPDAQPDHLPG